jgi:hypothetical protein
MRNFGSDMTSPWGRVNLAYSWPEVENADKTRSCPNQSVLMAKSYQGRPAATLFLVASAEKNVRACGGSEVAPGHD